MRHTEEAVIVEHIFWFLQKSDLRVFLSSIFFYFIPLGLVTTIFPLYMIMHAWFHCLTPHVFWCSSCFAFKCHLVSPLSLPQLQRMEYMQFLVELLLNIVLMISIRERGCGSFPILIHNLSVSICRSWCFACCIVVILKCTFDDGHLILICTWVAIYNLCTMCCRHRMIPLYCMDGEKKLRYCLVKVGLYYTDVLNPFSMWV